MYIINFLQMSRKYKFHNPDGLYFITFAVQGWVDVFTHNEYKDILCDNLTYCQKQKGLEIFAWCILHQNPEEEGWFFRAEDYVYSSAIDYAREKVLLEIVVIE